MCTIQLCDFLGSAFEFAVIELKVGELLATKCLYERLWKSGKWMDFWNSFNSVQRSVHVRFRHDFQLIERDFKIVISLWGACVMISLKVYGIWLACGQKKILSKILCIQMLQIKFFIFFYISKKIFFKAFHKSFNMIFMDLKSRT